MSESQVAETGETELESLKSVIQAFGASEDDAQALEPQLRSRRRALAEEFLALGDEQARARFSSPDGEALRLILDCGLRDLERDAQDEVLAGKTLARLSATTPPAGRALLAAMLLFHCFE